VEVKMTLVDALRDLYKKGQGRSELFEGFATYTNRRTELLVERAIEYTGLSYDTIVTLFRELDELGIGTFKLGRKGAKTRLVWNYSPRSVGEAARGDSDQLESYNGDEAIELSNSSPQHDREHADSMLDIPVLIAQAKRDLAAKLKISPDEITITVNITG
jgi:hypothetical protein